MSHSTSTPYGAAKSQFEYVSEFQDAFLALFPHRFDYIWAEHPHLGEDVAWQTESRHPLSDRLIRQGAYLFGVRFGAETNYCVLDIDAGSLYHPNRDPFAISRIVAALEPLGLVSYVACTSSYSGGLHLYFPFQSAQSSWQLAISLTCALETGGFKVCAGQLEIFPNPKPYATDGNLSLFNAHRLPMQIGSYLLDHSFEPIWSDTQTFVNQWQLVQQRNIVDSKMLRLILKRVKRKHFGISGKAEKFINDLNAEIELGWTAYGQTNRLLGRITMRAYIFHHILSGGDPLEGDALISEIVETARSLPGYREWCRHQHEIEQRATEWARCIQSSHYFHFGTQTKKIVQQSQNVAQNVELTTAIEQSPSWNQRQSAETRDRIRRAIADLLEQNNLPIKPTARFQALLKYGIGGSSLYRHRDLWHPDYFRLNPPCEANSYDAGEVQSAVENPPYPPNFKLDSQLDCVEDASNWHNPPSLFPMIGGNTPPGNGFKPQAEQLLHPEESNSLPISPDVNTDFSLLQDVQRQDVHYIQHVLADIEASQAANRETMQMVNQQQRQMKKQAAAARMIARMQQFFASGDPILMAEALAWAKVNSWQFDQDADASSA